MQLSVLVMLEFEVVILIRPWLGRILRRLIIRAVLVVVVWGLHAGGNHCLWPFELLLAIVDLIIGVEEEAEKAHLWGGQK